MSATPTNVPFAREESYSAELNYDAVNYKELVRHGNADAKTQLDRDFSMLFNAIQQPGEGSEFSGEILKKIYTLLSYGHFYCIKDLKNNRWNQFDAPVVSALCHGSRVLFEATNDQVAAEIFYWLFGNEAGKYKRPAATHGIEKAKEPIVVDEKLGVKKTLKERKVPVLEEAANVVVNTVSDVATVVIKGVTNAVTTVTSTMASLTSQDAKVAVSSLEAAIAQPLKGHYGINLAIGGAGNVHHISHREVKNDGTFGHLYIYYDGERGFLFGIEQSAPREEDNVGGAHTITGTHNPYSVTGGDDWGKNPQELKFTSEEKALLESKRVIYSGLQGIGSSEYYDGLFVAADSKTFLQIKAEYASLFAGKCPNDRLANLLMARNLNFGQIEEDEKHVKEKEAVEQKKRLEAELKKQEEEERKKKEQEVAQQREIALQKAKEEAEQKQRAEEQQAKLQALIDKADKEDDANAQYNLGVLYEEGKGGVEQDGKKALEYYEKAALQNDLQSLKRAGVFYEHGVLGCNKDFLRATAYYVRAAIAGDATTQVYLGKSYENGALGMVSVQEAIRYYRMAAERGNQVARTRLEHLHKAAPVVASVMPGKSATVVGHSIPSGNQDSALVSQSTAAALFLGIRPSILAVPSTQEEAAHPAQASSGEEVSKRRAIIGVFLIGIAIAGGIAVSIFFPPSLLLIAIGAGLAYAVGLYAVNTSSWWQNFKKQNPPAAKWLARAGIAFGLIIAVACPLLLVLGKLAILSLPAFTISAAPVATVVVSGAVPFVVGGATAIIGAKEIGNINTQVHPGPPVFSNMSNVHSLGDHQVPSSSVAISIANNVSKTTALSAASDEHHALSH